jgi:hypothetical protein
MNPTTKFLPSIILAGTLLAASLIWNIYQWSQISGQNEKISNLEKQLKQQDQKISQANDSLQSLKNKNEDLKAYEEGLKAQLETGAPAVASTEPAEPQQNRSGFRDFFARAMNDPEMKKTIENEFKRYVDRDVAAIAKELGLSPDQSKQLQAILLAKQEARMLSRFSGQQQDANSTQAAKDQSDQQLKNLLGNKYAQYQSYENTKYDRQALDQLKQQLSITKTPLQDAQSAQLLKIIEQEKKKTPIANLGDMRRNPELYRDQQAVDKLMADQQSLNSRVLTQASSFLNPEQLKALSESQNDQINRQKMGMRMSRRFWGGGSDTAASQAPTK